MKDNTVQLLRASAWSLVLILGVLSCRPLVAQVLYGSISGGVQDSSGAAIPNVDVIFTNTGTAQVIVLKTDAAGHYLRADFQQGQYTLKVTVPNFRPYIKTGIQVSAGDALRADVQLEIGSSSESIVVSAQELELQTDKTDLH